jgi:hypothetical protein
MRTRVTIIVLVAVVGALLPTSAALAAPNDWICEGVADGGFSDVDPTSGHKLDIDCLKFWEITSGTTPTTFSPKGAVTRWQMALFMMRIAGLEGLSGKDQGYLDILGLPVEYQTAINQVSQFGITTGTSSTTFDPNGSVNRWQMALFLTRLVHARGIALPNGFGQGFTDIVDLPASYQTAINQLAQLSITKGTSLTTFGPHDLVTREQMASFLIRTFKLIWSVGLKIEENCTPPIPTDPGIDPTPGTVCTANVMYPAGETFTVRHAWFAELPFFDAVEEARFKAAGTKIEVSVDGAPVVSTEHFVSLSGVELRWFEAVFAGGYAGAHIFEVRWYYEGELITTYRVTIQFS